MFPTVDIGQEREWNRNNTNANFVNNQPQVNPTRTQFIVISLFWLISIGLIVFVVLGNVNGDRVSYIPKQIQIESVSPWYEVSPPMINLSASNSSTTTQSLLWTIGFPIINTEKVTIFYRDIGVQVYRIAESDYQWTETAKVGSFPQGPENQSKGGCNRKSLVIYGGRTQTHGGRYYVVRTTTGMSFNVTLGLDVGCKRGNKMESRPPKKFKKKVFKCNDLKIEFDGNNGNASESEGRMYGGKPVACSELSFWWRSYSDAYKAVELADGLLV